jgi:hypothetical protein
MYPAKEERQISFIYTHIGGKYDFSSSHIWIKLSEQLAFWQMG